MYSYTIEYFKDGELTLYSNNDSLKLTNGILTYQNLPIQAEVSAPFPFHDILFRDLYCSTSTVGFNTTPRYFILCTTLGPDRSQRLVFYYQGVFETKVRVYALNEHEQKLIPDLTPLLDEYSHFIDLFHTVLNPNTVYSDFNALV